jgi:histidine ammonia-lyase
VHGASRDAISWVRLVAERELSAVTDNPLLFVLPGDDEPWDRREHADNPRRFGRASDASPAYSGGNFHGQPVALAADLLAIAVTELADVSERRLAILVNPAHSRGLPPHLSRRPGLQSGLMIAQYTAASLVSECRTLAHPASVDNVPTGNGAEDHVSMSTWAARKARTVVGLATHVVALELLAAAQANEWRCVVPDPSVRAAGSMAIDRSALDEAFAQLRADDVAAELGAGTAAAYRTVRSLSPSVRHDRPLSEDVARVAEALRGGGLVASPALCLPLRRLGEISARLD